MKITRTQTSNITEPQVEPATTAQADEQPQPVVAEPLAQKPALPAFEAIPPTEPATGREVIAYGPFILKLTEDSLVVRHREAADQPDRKSQSGLYQIFDQQGDSLYVAVVFTPAAPASGTTASEPASATTEPEPTEELGPPDVIAKEG